MMWSRDLVEYVMGAAIILNNMCIEALWHGNEIELNNLATQAVGDTTFLDENRNCKTFMWLTRHTRQKPDNHVNSRSAANIAKVDFSRKDEVLHN